MDILKLLIFLLLVFFIEYHFRFTNLFVEKEGFYQNNTNTKCVLPALDDYNTRFDFIKSNKCPVDEWDVSKVINMKGLFSGANTPPPITHIDSSTMQRTILPADLSSWNVSNVTNMEHMFGHQSDHTYQIKGIEGWDVSSVTNMKQMFYSNDTFNNTITRWNVSNVKDMASMFKNAAAFNQDIRKWDVSSVTKMKQMFYNASKFNQDISNWNVSNVIDFTDIFKNSGLDDALIQTILCKWKDKLKNNEEGMKSINNEIKMECSTGKTVTISTPNEPTTPGCYYLLPRGCSNYRSNSYDFRNKWILSKSILDNAIKYHDSANYNTRTGFNPLKYQKDCLERARQVESHCGTDSEIKTVFNEPPPPTCELINAIDENIATGSVINWKSQQTKTEFYNDCPDYSKWNITGVKNMYALIANDKNTNINIGKWDVSKVENMYEMFLGATNFNQDISKWDVSKVENMSSMFSGALAFNQDISKWDVSKVENMYEMFLGATNFNQDISKWDVSNVKNLSSMFSGALAFNQDIGNWDVSNVKNLNSMFSGATNFNQDISKWDVSNVIDFTDIFKNSGIEQELKKKILCSWVLKLKNTGQEKGLNSLLKVITANNMSCVSTTSSPVSNTPTSTLQGTSSPVSNTPTSTLQGTSSPVSRTTPIPTAASDMGTNIRVHLNSSFNDFIKPNYKSQTTTTPEMNYSSVKEQNIVLNIDDDLKKFIHNKLDIMSSGEDDNNKTKFSCS